MRPKLVVIILILLGAYPLSAYQVHIEADEFTHDPEVLELSYDTANVLLSWEGYYPGGYFLGPNGAFDANQPPQNLFAPLGIPGEMTITSLLCSFHDKGNNGYFSETYEEKWVLEAGRLYSGIYNDDDPSSSVGSLRASLYKTCASSVPLYNATINSPSNCNGSTTNFPNSDLAFEWVAYFDEPLHTETGTDYWVDLPVTAIPMWTGSTTALKSFSLLDADLLMCPHR